MRKDGVGGARQLLHEKVAEALLRDIDRGFYPRGTHLPSEAALCAQFNVSRTTLRRALNKLAEQGLIRAQPGIGHRVGGSIVSRRETGSGLVAVLAPYASGEPFFAEFIGSLERGLAEANLHLVVCSSGEGPGETAPEQAQRILGMQPRAAVICCRWPCHDSDPFSPLKSAGIRVVEVIHQSVDSRADFVGTDDRLASLIVTEWLLRWSGGRLAVVGRPAPLPGLEKRLEGFHLAARLHGVSHPRVVHLPSLEAPLPTQGEAPPPPSEGRWGVFCPWMEEAEAVAAALAEAGLELGRDAALGAIGSPPWVVPPAEVPLALAAWPAASLGQEAARLAAHAGREEHVLVAPELAIDPAYARAGPGGKEGGEKPVSAGASPLH